MNNFIIFNLNILLGINFIISEILTDTINYISTINDTSIKNKSN